jgi:hypothetical protein
MLRIFLTLALFALPFHTEEPATGRSWIACKPLWGGTRLDLKTPEPLHLMIPIGRAIKLHEPINVWLLECPPQASCDTVEGAKATMTIDSDEGNRWTGSYAVMRKDGTRQEGRFVAVALKEKFHGCL